MIKHNMHLSGSYLSAGWPPQLPVIIQGTESKFKVTEEMAAKSSRASSQNEQT
jgi:hypothetical protein